MWTTSIGPEHTTGSQYTRLEYPGQVELGGCAALLAGPLADPELVASELARWMSGEVLVCACDEEPGFALAATTAGAEEPEPAEATSEDAASTWTALA